MAREISTWVGGNDFQQRENVKTVILAILTLNSNMSSGRLKISCINGFVHYMVQV
jgi:hypothetical protein